MPQVTGLDLRQLGARAKTQARSRATLRTARKEIRRRRQEMIDGASIGMSGKIKDVHHAGSLREIHRLDRLIARFDEAIVFFGAQ